jgi:hypothetical protein
MDTSEVISKDFVEHKTVAVLEKWDPDQVAYAVKQAKLPDPQMFRKPQLRAYARHNPELVRYDSRKSGLLEPKGVLLRQFVEPERLVLENNAITTQGLGQLTNALIGTGGLVLIGATTTRVGTGNGSTAFNTADTDLSAAAGSTNRWFQIVDSAPTRSTTTVTNDTVSCVATFGTSDGNYVWSEWGINTSTATPASSNAVIAGTFWNRKVVSMGTKVAGAVWAFTAKISFA